MAQTRWVKLVHLYDLSGDLQLVLVLADKVYQTVNDFLIHVDLDLVCKVANPQYFHF